MGWSVNNGTGNVSERSKSNATQKSKTPTAPNTGLTCKQIMEYLQGKIQGKIQTIKQADDGAKLDYFNAYNTTFTTHGPAQGAEHKCLPEQVIRDSHSPPRRAQALQPDPQADSGTGRFEVSASSTTLGALGWISIYIRGMHDCAEFKEPPASPKATLALEEQLNIYDVVLGFGLYPDDALLGLGWCPSGCLFSEDEVSVQVYEAIDIDLSKTQMIGPRPDSASVATRHSPVRRSTHASRGWERRGRKLLLLEWPTAQPEQIFGSNSKRLRVGPATTVYSRNSGKPHL